MAQLHRHLRALERQRTDPQPNQARAWQVGDSEWATVIDLRSLAIWKGKRNVILAKTSIIYIHIYRYRYIDGGGAAFGYIDTK
jgi:hypothetical protein